MPAVDDAVRCALAAFGVALLVSCTPSAGPRTAAAGTGSIIDVFPAHERLPLPALVGKTVDGQPLDVGRLAGHGILVINVWASWCESCRAESLVLAQAAQRHEATFVGIDVQDSADRARLMVENAGIRYPQLSDPDGALLGTLSLLPRQGIPSTLVVDRHGLMAARVIGAVTAPQLQRLLHDISRNP